MSSSICRFPSSDQMSVVFSPYFLFGRVRDQSVPQTYPVFKRDLDGAIAPI